MGSDQIWSSRVFQGLPASSVLMQVDSRKEIKTAVDLAFKKDGQVLLAKGMFSCHASLLRLGDRSTELYCTGGDRTTVLYRRR